jgi:hypothetical protein
MSHARIRELEALNRTSFVSLALQLSSVTIERLRAGVEDFQKERFRELQVKAQQKLLLLSNVSRKTTTTKLPLRLLGNGWSTCPNRN